MLWNVLIPTIGRRADRFAALAADLSRQAAPYHGAVQVTAYWNNGREPLGSYRQQLVEWSQGEYVSFVDDDDELPDYHVRRVVEALESRPDYVGWRIQAYVDDLKLKPTFHSLRYSEWSEDLNGYYRDVSHLNPVRRELALLADFRRGDPPEDVSWASQLRPYLRGKREEYVDDVMYVYRARSADSAWRFGDVGSDREARHVPPSQAYPFVNVVHEPPVF